MDELKINTTGWIEVSCDKCGKTSCYDPAFYTAETGCFGCQPVTTPEEFDSLVAEGKI
jgi:hypothetical protein